MTLMTTLAQHVTRRPQRMALLEQIAVQGSITRAAKAAGLSYKAAWDAIDELNNLAEEPLVQRSVGGKGGGGAKLSAAGERLLVLYKRLENLQAQVLAAEDDHDLQLLGRLMLRTSARNQLSGRVRAIHPQGRNDLIDIELPGGAQIQAQITCDSTEKLELAEDRPVIALIKAGWLELNALSSAADPTRNQLQGWIEQIIPAADGPSEVRIGLASGQTLCALADASHLREQHLHASDPVRAQFAANQVLLGTPV
ncbi:ModE family transcriptional regulator [Pseudomonas taeanensis MS-3]|uniref:ModE family transcriptional regulator n=1 Tax=Pseudomonas taeanensis MS-3 TaxID=1395571 RepID=A0A0A1YP89_9PSED|nr:TOBE domain-containing protein [Pseudomonas taeanensis]KFX70449.1 ModE family transcriptional regulator [Pseudomonas taeanensis MS-3]